MGFGFSSVGSSCSCSKVCGYCGTGIAILTKNRNTAIRLTNFLWRRLSRHDRGNRRRNRK